MSEQSNDLREQDSNLPHNDTSAMKARRSFLIKGAAVAPLIAAATSRPVWAGDDSCINSGTLSGNLSNHGCQAVGRSPGWWWNKNGSAQWDKTDYLQSQTFSSIFGYVPLSFNDKAPTPFSNTTLLGDLGPKRGSGSNSVDTHAIAAILNFSHPGIMYSGNTGIHHTAGDVIWAYQQARAAQSPLRESLLNQLLRELDSYSVKNVTI